MAEDQGQERTEQATSRKREQARQEGNFATSREVSTLFMVAGGTAGLYVSAMWMQPGQTPTMPLFNEGEAAAQTPTNPGQELEGLKRAVFANSAIPAMASPFQRWNF